MKRIILLTALLLCTIAGVCQKTKIDGVEYEVISSTEAKVKKGKDASGRVEIPENVTIKGKTYRVTEIGEKAFYKNDNVYVIIVPNSVTHIRKSAFEFCTWLKQLILPDDAYMDNSWWLDSPIAYCKQLSIIRGHNDPLPEYIVQTITEVFSNSPVAGYDIYWGREGYEAYFYEGKTYYANVGVEYSLTPPFFRSLQKIKNGFEYYAYHNIKNNIAEWQKKKEYETTTQYQQRVTIENRQKEIEKLSIRLRNEYIEKNKPEILKGAIGTYDADYNIFPIETECGNTFVQVPMEEAQTFKQSWNNVKMNPTYGIIDNGLAILSCEFTLNGKTYQSPASYNKQNSDVAINLPPLEISLDGGTTIAENQMKPTPVTVDNSLDINIPVEAVNNAKTFAVIIGNENYQHVSSVPYAKNDAKIFATYCQKTLGLPQSNVRSYENATFGTILTALADVKAIAEAYNGDINLIFYYAGHGIPNEKDNSAYLLPIDVDGKQIEACFSVTRLYSELQSLNTRSVVVFMDACFSGAQRGDGMLASARGVAIKAKSAAPQGNIVVFSAASGDETAYPYKEKGHGMFTYFLLKKLNETKGNVTLGELGDYITTQVKQQSIVVNRKSQTPTVVPSSAMSGEWRGWKLK